MGYFTDLINKKETKPIENRGSVYVDENGKLQFPLLKKPYIDPNLKISAPTGKELSLEQLPVLEREKARAEIRQSDLQVAGKKTNFLQLIAQSFPRAVMSFGLEAVKGGEMPFTPKTNFEKLLYGEEPIKSVSQMAIEAEPLASSIVGKKAGLPVSTLFAFGLTALDLTPFGGTKKGLTKEIIEATTDDIAKALLKKAGVADDLAEAYASQVVKAKTAKEAEAIITRLDDLARTTKKTILPVEDALAQEARKYKTAEEFYKVAKPKDFQEQVIAGQDMIKEIKDAGLRKTLNKDGTITFYHGTTPENADIILKNGKLDEMTFGSPLKSKSAFGSEGATKYGKSILELKVDPRDVNFNSGSGEMEAIDGLIRGQDNVWRSPKRLSLTDIYNQAVKTTPDITETTQLPEQAIPQIGKQIEKQTPRLEQSLEQTLKVKGKNPQIVLSLTNDTTKLIKNIGVNTDNLNISKTGKNLINETIESIKPKLQQKVGKVLTNKEVIEIADRSAKILKETIGNEATKNWEVALLNARKKLAASAESGTVDRDFIENLLTIKTQGTDIARKLQSFGIGADPLNISSKQAILEAIIKVNDNVDEILKAAKGVDFNDFNQATEFYRQFVKPTFGEWVDLLRYNSMLSSPKTHLVNTFSNLLNTTFIAPLEKATQGGVDFLSSKITGNARKAFAGESVKFIQGYFSNLKKATTNFADVLKGKSPITQLDLKYIPFSKKGAKGKIAKVLAYPTRLLEASDRFFMDLTQAGERAALEYRAGKGVAVKEIEEKALDAARYRLYRQELFSPEQGKVLDAVDHFTSTLMNLRNSKNPIVSTISKFTVPFVKTPMNIFKQGVEYSPLGVSTLIGAKNKQQQLAKAIVGSTFFAGAATLVASDRLSGAEPRDANGIRDWRSAGKQPYSVKIGNKWVSYQKFPPAISFSFSLLSTINDTLKDRKIDDSIVDTTLSAVSKYGQFLSDQSYAKSIGDMLGAIQGGEAGIERLISNYPQQLIPFRALGSWFARMFDASQRKVDNKAEFIDKQIQQLMINMPFLSMAVPAREDKDGNPIPNYNRFWNAFSPVDIKTENEKFAKFLNDKEQFNKAIKEEQDEKTKIKQDVQPVYDNVQQLLLEGRKDDAQKIVDSLTDEQYEAYKSIKSSDKSKQTIEMEAKVFPIYQKVQELLSSGNEQEAKDIVNGLTNEEYKAYKLIKNRLQ